MTTRHCKEKNKTRFGGFFVAKMMGKATLLLVAAISVSGCALRAGFAYHPSTDRPEVNLDNTLFVIQAGGCGGVGQVKPFAQHVSGVLTKESGYGLNMGGALLRLR